MFIPCSSFIIIFDTLPTGGLRTQSFICALLGVFVPIEEKSLGEGGVLPFRASRCCISLRQSAPRGPAFPMPLYFRFLPAQCEQGWRFALVLSHFAFSLNFLRLAAKFVSEIKTF